MTVPVRLLVFALLLVMVFVVAVAVGSAVGQVGTVLSFGAGSGL